MVIQMIAVGEESGSLDSMSAKVATFYEAEVDNAVDSMSSLLEPLIMAILGVLVGGLVIAMYLPYLQAGLGRLTRRQRPDMADAAPRAAFSLSKHGRPHRASVRLTGVVHRHLRWCLVCWSEAFSTSSSIAFPSCWSASGASSAWSWQRPPRHLAPPGLGGKSGAAVQSSRTPLRLPGL